MKLQIGMWRFWEPLPLAYPDERVGWKAKVTKIYPDGRYLIVFEDESNVIAIENELNATKTARVSL